ncbi:hypothetical protein H4Q26_003620 [Puccinia striiformis f. sp. tritici PST-130]|uniref:Glycosyl hydrolase family 63 C-terminal domain-containing protein n=1 Tax=Puccinia striiformis f. sp. tritici PST-78 TaxID=1165861 RepID=A0A0L0VT26_9BASI|nr:hypothetical protein H4Q26_003620 [Puccinia striiformis f. sp. tritici PST-130]KNF02160.1 hypothetical protein PSTG_04656 [Puccinia striiformis f. sp. tritici PST-78]
MIFLEILQSWIRLIDRDGWVDRDQLLGEEARSVDGSKDSITDADLAMGNSGRQSFKTTGQISIKLLEDARSARSFRLSVHHELKLNYELKLDKFENGVENLGVRPYLSACELACLINPILSLA